MKFKEFKNINKFIKLSDYIGMCSKIKIKETDFLNNFVTIKKNNFEYSVYINNLIDEIILKRNCYLSNPDRLKSWGGWSK